MTTPETINHLVKKHLAAERDSGNPERARWAQEALKANQQHGIGRWAAMRFPVIGKRVVPLRQKGTR